MSEQAETKAPVLLTQREKEVLALICEGKSNKDIAGKLCLTLSTVKAHVHKILYKYGVKDRKQLIVIICKLKEGIENV